MFECWNLAFFQVSILKRANLSAGDIAQLADAVEPIAFADGETQQQQLNTQAPHYRGGMTFWAQFTTHAFISPGE